jgi:hypothetical protein
MQESNSEISKTALDAEIQQQELMAITAFCHSQKPLIQALHDNVARVYGKAGVLRWLPAIPSPATSHFLSAARELSSWTRQKIASGSEAAAPGQVLQPAAAQPVSVALRCAAAWCVRSFICLTCHSASGSLKRVRASAPDENLLMCNENMGDDA